MKRAALLLLAVPALLGAASTPQLTLPQEAAMRCSATFGLIASEQSRGAPGADRFVPLQSRGREYFVRTTARLMDEAGLSREAVTQVLQKRINDLQTEMGKVKDPDALFMAQYTACLPMLDAEVPPTN